MILLYIDRMAEPTFDNGSPCHITPSLPGVLVNPALRAFVLHHTGLWRSGSGARKWTSSPFQSHIGIFTQMSLCTVCSTELSEERASAGPAQPSLLTLQTTLYLCLKKNM